MHRTGAGGVGGHYIYVYIYREAYGRKIRQPKDSIIKAPTGCSHAELGIWGLLFCSVVPKSLPGQSDNKNNLFLGQAY